MKFFLPAEVNVPVKSYHCLAQPLSIIFGTCKNPDVFVMNEFIQLMYEKTYTFDTLSDERLTFYLALFVQWEPFNADILFREDISNNIVEEIKKLLKKEKYVFIILDEFYLSYHIAYQNLHFKHDYLICGFDDECQSFQALFYKNGFYQKSFLPYQEVNNAYDGCGDTLYSLVGIKVKEKYKNKPFQLNRELITRHIDDYLSSNNSFYWFAGSQPTFGLNTYDEITKLKTDKNKFDVRHFCILSEHKKIMYHRIKKYFAQTELGNQYKSISILAENLKLVVMKSNSSQDKRYKEYLISSLIYMKKEEESLLSIFKQFLLEADIDEKIFT